MMQFSNLVMLVAVLPWGLFLAWLLLQQRRPVQLLAENMNRTRAERFTIYHNNTRLYLHFGFLFLAGCFLIIAMAGPYKTGLVNQTRQVSDVVFVVDASFSMYARDVKRRKGEKKKIKNRFQQAKAIAKDLLNAVPGARVGLVSFSGQAPIHAPPTIDHVAVREHLDTLKVHFFQETGSSFKSVFESLLHLFAHRRVSSQVVLISDGELPFEQNYEQELKLLVKNKIIIHGIGVGSKRGARVHIYDPEDVLNYAKKPKIGKKIKTYREDEHLEKFADETGGEYLVIENGDSLESIVKALLKPVDGVALKGKGRISIASWFIFLFVFCIFIEMVYFANPGAFSGMINFLQKIYYRLTGKQAALLLLVVFSSWGCYGDLRNSHQFNQGGINKSNKGHLGRAQVDFEKSLAYQVRPQIAIYNLGKNHIMKGDYSSAHKAFTDALEIDPGMIEAIYNDGHALFYWGDREFDRKNCDFDRAQALWKLSFKRFEEVYQKSWPMTELRENAAFNAEYVEKRLKNIKKECEQQDKKDNPRKDQKQEQKDNKDKNQQSQGGKNQGQNNQAEGRKNKAQQGQGKGQTGGSLSKEEKQQIKAARRRIKQQKKNKTHRQTKIEQLRRGEGRKNVGKQIWW